jgi:hypothetical protein
MARGSNTPAKAEEEKTNLPSTQVYDYGQDAGAGFEGVSNKDLSIPFIAVLQSNSPMVVDEAEGAKPGLLVNTVTGELISGETGVVFQPCHTEDKFVEWVPRDQGGGGGGFVAAYDPTDPAIKDVLSSRDGNTGKIILENGNELVETKYAYGLTLNADGSEVTGFAAVAFTSTKIKPYRDWKTSMYMIKGKPPLFANRCILRTTKQKNNKGTFYNFEIKPLRDNWVSSLIDPKTEAELLVQAKTFREMVMSGAAKAAFDTQNKASGKGGEADTGDNAPF